MMTTPTSSAVTSAHIASPDVTPGGSPAGALAHVETVAFDADDTLWHNEDGFHQVEQDFEALLTPFVDRDAPPDVLAALADRERRNVSVFGYGVKSFTFSMLEVARSLSDGRIGAADLGAMFDQIVGFGRWLLTREVAVFEHALPTLQQLSVSHRLVLVTKGDSHHQAAKLTESGLAGFFDHVEIVAEKDPLTYELLAARHHIDLRSFVMVGNSLKSDVLPVLAVGAHAVHIPYDFTWALEHAEIDAGHPGADRFHQLESLGQLPHLLIDPAAS